MKIILLVACLALPALAIEATDQNGQRVNCQASTMFAHSTSMKNCGFNDEVMVGIDSVDPLRIRCARLQVRCDRPAVESPEKAIETDRDAR